MKPVLSINSQIIKEVIRIAKVTDILQTGHRQQQRIIQIRTMCAVSAFVDIYTYVEVLDGRQSSAQDVHMDVDICLWRKRLFLIYFISNRDFELCPYCILGGEPRVL